MAGSSNGAPPPPNGSSATGPVARALASLSATARAIHYEHFLAGISGGVVSTLVLHPLDLLKIRFAVDDGHPLNRPRYSGLRHAFHSIVEQEGVRGFYKGVTPNIAGAGTAWGFYFLL